MFEIKIETIGALNAKDNDDCSAIDAIETIYNFPEDKVVFKFGEIEFTAFLSGNISDSWYDILGLMNNIKSEKKEFDMQFPSQTFWHYWKFKEINEDFWEIEAFWSYEEKKKIKVEKNIIKNEFQKLIQMVESDLRRQNYILEKFREYSKR